MRSGRRSSGSGAKDDTVTEKNGTPLAEDDPPARSALAWLDAVFAENKAALDGMWAGAAPLGDFDFKLWKSARPHPAHLLRGFRNDATATLWRRAPNEKNIPGPGANALVLAPGGGKGGGEKGKKNETLP